MFRRLPACVQVYLDAFFAPREAFWVRYVLTVPSGATNAASWARVCRKRIAHLTHNEHVSLRDQEDVEWDVALCELFHVLPLGKVRAEPGIEAYGWVCSHANVLCCSIDDWPRYAPLFPKATHLTLEHSPPGEYMKRATCPQVRTLTVNSRSGSIDLRYFPNLRLAYVLMTNWVDYDISLYTVRTIVSNLPIIHDSIRNKLYYEIKRN